MKKLIAAAILATGLALGSSAAQAACITFTDTVLGQIDVASFDWKVGNAVSMGGVTGTTANLYYQASLGNFLDENGDEITGTGRGTQYEVTVVAGFQQNITRPTSTSAEFTLGAGGGFFEIWYDDITTTNTDGGVRSNDLSGLGFRDGTKIASGSIIKADGNFSLTGGPVQFDQFGTNNYGTLQTLTGNGATSFTGETLFSDAAFIKGCNSLIIDLLFGNSSQITPFIQTNPSGVFLEGTIDPVLGAVNGQSGPDFQFQADGVSSFTVVPVPGAVWLLGSGILGMLGLRRKFA